MDRTRYSLISHGQLSYQNPIGSPKMERALDRVSLAPGARALDVGAGKGELAIRLVERFGASVTAVDISPLMTDELKRRARGRIPPDRLTLRLGDAGSFMNSIRDPLDLGACVGATHAFGGLMETLEALDQAVRPGGLVLVGEGFWMRPPDPGYLKALDCDEAYYRSHEKTVEAGVRRGFIPLYAAVASDDEWDEYEWTTMSSIEGHVLEHPDDPDAESMLLRARSWREIYLKWGRSTLGFGLYLFRKPVSSSPAIS